MMISSDNQFELLLNNSIIKMNNVSKIYGSEVNEIRALDNINLNIEEGSAVTLMGPSGSGKSTLLNMLGAMDVPTYGEVIVNGINISQLPESKLANYRRFSIGFVFQSFYLLPNVDVLRNVLVPKIPYGITKRDKKRAQELLEAVGLGDRANSKVKQLSGGQSQRVAIARSLINDPKVILADEPTGNLDSETGKTIIDLLLGLTEEQNKTIVIVTHDPRVGSAINDHPRGRNIWLDDGQISDIASYDQFCWD